MGRTSRIVVPLARRDNDFQAEWRLLAEDLVGPLHQRHQIRWSHEPGILAFKVGVADRTGPGARGSNTQRYSVFDRLVQYL